MLPATALNSTLPLVSPRALALELAPEKVSLDTVESASSTVKKILEGKDKRLLVVAGPCSVHDRESALEYASKLAKLRHRYINRIYILMRVYFEKPRSTVGWKGMIYDPNMDGSCDIASGLRAARKLLMSITKMGLPAGMEILNPLVSCYIADLISWASVGARTSESQIHREMVSGLPIAAGFKNSTDGSLESAVNSIEAARLPHSFLNIDCYGRVCITRTEGNPWGHLILRGGKSGPNYDCKSVERACKLLSEIKTTPSLIIDCSHMNAHKKHINQAKVCREVIRMRSSGFSCIRGVMIESNLEEGRQEITVDKGLLKYGVSVTDECIGWDETEELIGEIYAGSNYL